MQHYKVFHQAAEDSGLYPSTLSNVRRNAFEKKTTSLKKYNTSNLKVNSELADKLNILVPKWSVYWGSVILSSLYNIQCRGVFCFLFIVEGVSNQSHIGAPSQEAAFSK